MPAGRWLRFLIPAGLFAVLIGVFFVSLKRDKETLPSTLIGKPAPAFSLPRLDDPALKVSNSDFAGRAYVVNVWGSWCAPCRQEHPTLMEIARRNEVPLVGFSWHENRNRALEWLRQRGDPYDVNASDEDGRTAIDWGVYGAPETFLVDAQGIVRYKHVSVLTMQVWEEKFLPLIKQADSAVSGVAE